MSVHIYQYAIALGQNDLLAVQDRLRTFASPVRIVWGDSDQIFTKEWSEKLSATFPNSRGVKHVERAKLFFPEGPQVHQRTYEALS